MIERTLYFDGEPVKVEFDEFEIIKLMVLNPSISLVSVVNDLIFQGYKRSRAMQLAVLARREINDVEGVRQ